MTIASIIVPFYNQKRFLEQCLGSALAQTMRAIEVVLVNDGSAEDPTSIVERFGDDRIKVISQANAGVAAARNAAIAAAQGEFLAFLDADDWIAPTMIENLVTMLRCRPEVGLAYCDITRVNAAGDVADQHTIANSRSKLDGNILPALLAGGYFPPASVVVRASVIGAVGGFDTELGGCCDWDLWIRIAAAGYTASFCNARLAFYRLHEESMSKSTQHMSETALATLAKNMAAHPRQIAESFHSLIELSSAMWSANIDAEKRIQILNKKIDDQHASMSQLEKNKIWLEQQWQSNLEAVKQRDLIVADQKAYMLQLEKNKDWLEKQWHCNVEAVKQREQIIADQKLYISQLVQGKDWLEKQWHSNVEAVKQQEVIIDTLKAQSKGSL